MSTDPKEKTLGQAIDEIVQALTGLNESARSTAIKAACEHLKIPELSQATNLSNERSRENHASSSILQKVSGNQSGTDIKTLKIEKSPSSAIEMLCIVGYYLQELAPTGENKQTISGSDIDVYFRHAGYPLPKAKGQLLVDAKAAGYFDSAARGEYKLNAVGHNLVAHNLPRGRKNKE